jgi:hypothetical protein
LGLLALAHSDDIRAFDLTWVAKAAMGKPGQLLILWPFLLLWIAAMIAASMLLWVALVTIVAVLGLGGCLGWLIGVLIGVAGVAVIAAVCVMFVTVLFRCVGMLGRYNPEFLEMIPEVPRPAKSFAFILGGVFVSLGMLYFVIFPPLRELLRPT